MPRASHARTGSITTRRPSSVSATTSWPGTNGKLTIGSNHRDERPSTVARSLPHIPVSRGVSRSQPGPGSSGGATSTRRSGPKRPPAPGLQPDADAGHGEPGQRAFDLEGLHISLRPAAAPVLAHRGAEGQQRAPDSRRARGQCSTCQPRLRARAASLVSGLTATGYPAASSIGRSLVESA